MLYLKLLSSQTLIFLMLIGNSILQIHKKKQFFYTTTTDTRSFITVNCSHILTKNGRSEILGMLQTYFLVCESQKRMNRTSFAQHVSVIFLVLVIVIFSSMLHGRKNNCQVDYRTGKGTTMKYQVS
jgi:hypothetical protein